LGVRVSDSLGEEPISYLGKRQGPFGWVLLELAAQKLAEVETRDAEAILPAVDPASRSQRTRSETPPNE
jgi:hypothetical protein